MENRPRVYADGISPALTAAGYKDPFRTIVSKGGVIIDDTMGFEAEPRTYEGVCPSLRASRQGLKTITGIIDPQGRKEKIPKLQKNCPTLRAQIHGNPPCAVYEVRNDEGNSVD